MTTDNDDLLTSFLKTVKSDLDSPITSTFGNHISAYRDRVRRPLPSRLTFT